MSTAARHTGSYLKNAWDGHPERSEGSKRLYLRRFFTSLRSFRMTSLGVFEMAFSVLRENISLGVCLRWLKSCILLSILAVVASSFPVIAQSSGSITGKIVDAKTGEGLPSVNVLVKGTYYGTSSDV